MYRAYRRLGENLARVIEDERRDRWEEERAHGAREAREYTQAARERSQETAERELERLRVCGLITQEEFERRHNRLRLRKT